MAFELKIGDYTAFVRDVRIVRVHVFDRFNSRLTHSWRVDVYDINDEFGEPWTELDEFVERGEAEILVEELRALLDESEQS